MGDRASNQSLASWIDDARARLLSFVDPLTTRQMTMPYGETVNPYDWEAGHAGFFYDAFIRGYRDGLPLLIPNGTDLFNSHSVPHKERWKLELPDWKGIRDYIEEVRAAIQEDLKNRELTDADHYLYRLAIFHEDMHGDAFCYSHQLLRLVCPQARKRLEGSLSRMDSADITIPRGSYRLGAEKTEPFVHDNEKWSHEVPIEEFRIAPHPVTNEQYLAFIDDGGYTRQDLWSLGGKIWLRDSGAVKPVYWTKENGDWLRWDFDAQVALEAREPAVHINWWEAQAYCSWADRRLPTEAEWELAASGYEKKRYPWGDSPDPAGERANFDCKNGLATVDRFEKGDSPFGCRQMQGNIWEWTASDFFPYPGFSADKPYMHYSVTSFGYHKVMRGGSWVNRSRMLRNTWRNYYLPHRNDVFVGFRTCAR